MPPRSTACARHWRGWDERVSLIGFLIDRIFPPPPTEFEHPGIGRLEQDRHRPNCYAGAVDWPVGAAHDGQVTLILHGQKPTRGGLKNAAGHFLAMRERAAQVRDAAAEIAGEQMYEKWCDESFENDKSLDRWQADLAIERIWVDPLGHVGIDFQFNEPFRGHHLTVSGIAPDRFEYANLSI